jgi:hypothetical protein
MARSLVWRKEMCAATGAASARPARRDSSTGVARAKRLETQRHIHLPQRCLGIILCVLVTHQIEGAQVPLRRYDVAFRSPWMTTRAVEYEHYSPPRARSGHQVAQPAQRATVNATFCRRQGPGVRLDHKRSNSCMPWQLTTLWTGHLRAAGLRRVLPDGAVPEGARPRFGMYERPIASRADHRK